MCVPRRRQGSRPGARWVYSPQRQDNIGRWLAMRHLTGLYIMDLPIYRLAFCPNQHHLHRPPRSRGSSFRTPFRKLSPSLMITGKARSSSSSSSFDAAAFEAERLRLDAEARNSMVTASATAEEESDPKAWKWTIRKRVWDLMEVEGLARFPRPVHHRIPNFVGAAAAADLFGRLEAFQHAQCVKVNPDSPQKQVRFLTLAGGKKLLTPQPRLRTGFFSILEAQKLPPGAIHEACTSVGVAKYGKPIKLDEKIKVDLIVIGSVAVDPKTGARLGKGEGFAELEYGMLRYMGAIDDSTLIVTSDKERKSKERNRAWSQLDMILSLLNLVTLLGGTLLGMVFSSVHDRQLVDDIPVEKLLIHDVSVDIICTPSRVIFTHTTIPKPQGIYWEKLSPEKLGQIKVLRELKSQIELETGKRLPLGPSEKLPPTAQRRRQ